MNPYNLIIWLETSWSQVIWSPGLSMVSRWTEGTGGETEVLLLLKLAFLPEVLSYKVRCRGDFPSP